MICSSDAEARLRICGKLLDGGKGRQGPETLTLIGCGHEREGKVQKEKGGERNRGRNARKRGTTRNV